MWVRGHGDRRGVDQLPEPFDLLGQSQGRDLLSDSSQDPVGAPGSAPDWREACDAVGRSEPVDSGADRGTLASHMHYLDHRGGLVDPSGGQGIRPLDELALIAVFKTAAIGL